jgi:hypothetical protein
MPLSGPQLGVGFRRTREAERGQHGFSASKIDLPHEQVDVVPGAQVGLRVVRAGECRALQHEQVEARGTR